ncbi:uncharacterized protein EV154DRAFT_561263 [Mucor mucedo]|uniref:uncharacterized protein n=1 Tax=Mucor mucedo TaxID=29922 RepID=UPI002220E677|nr:uncharacterized protein EV154DRAFT_561263 [Mucor mucedo]KAI7893515.1 hypothetical protein EV154DRAFT_561263 [Mucor mucedo]
MASFDLFGELSSEEQNELEKRQTQLRQNVQEKLKALPQDPLDRTMADNRMVFTHKRQALFGKPGIHCNLLSKEECRDILNICNKRTEWTTARHSAFATTDIPIRSDPRLAYLESLVKQRLFPELAHFYGFKVADLDFRDIFLVKYSAKAQKGLKMHTDGCLFSLTLLISDPTDFEGGGTYYQSIDKVLHLNQGDVAYHDARVMHSGIDITKGSRYILVAFIDTKDTIDKDKRANKTMLRSQ